MRRRVEPETIDDPSSSQEDVEYLLSCVRITNRRLGGTDMLLDRLKQWSARWPVDRPITLLDIGTGAADLPLAAVAWARSAGFELRVTALDSNDRVLAVARRFCQGERSITFVKADAMSLVDPATSPYQPGSFDYVHAGMFLHHLDDAAVPRMLSAMDRLARAGIVWNDLIRSRRGYALAWVATIGRRIRHDCLASLRAGFTGTEVLAMAGRAGLTYARYHDRFPVQRFALAGEKPRAWDPPGGRRTAPVPTRAQ